MSPASNTGPASGKTTGTSWLLTISLKAFNSRRLDAYFRWLKCTIESSGPATHVSSLYGYRTTRASAAAVAEAAGGGVFSVAGRAEHAHRFSMTRALHALRAGRAETCSCSDC